MLKMGRRQCGGICSIWHTSTLASVAEMITEANNRDSHLKILLHRHNFHGQDRGDNDGHVAVAAASRISRIAEDMLTHGTLRYGQMHLYVVYVRIFKVGSLSDTILGSRAYSPLFLFMQLA